MKVTIENKKGLSKDLKVFVDKKTLEGHLNDKYDEISKTVQLKGFRPGKLYQAEIIATSYKCSKCEQED